MTAHLIYGVGLRANVAIAGLRGLATVDHADISLTIGTLPDSLVKAAADPQEPFYVSDDRDARGEPLLVVTRLMGGEYHRLCFADGTCVVVDSSGARIWAEGADGATLEDTAAYILGPALGFALRLRGVTCLHASCVSVGSGAVAFVGGAGAGKSTLAAAFARRGSAVLTDDLAALTECGDRFEIQPAYPRVRLWPDSVEALFGRADALPRITPTWDKRFLALDGTQYHFASAALPAVAIFVLGGRVPGVPRIESLSTREALMALVPETYSARLLDRAQRAREFDELGRLVERVEVHRLVPSSDPARLDQACELVVRHVSSATAVPA